MRVAWALSLSLAGCGLLDDGYAPCPSDGAGAPVPGPVIEPTTGTGYNGATERYRKLSDGTVCVCGEYEIGCHENPEGADSSMVCGFDAQGQPECEPYVMPPPPAAAAPDAEELSDALLKWSCPYRWKLRSEGSGGWVNDARTRMAQTYTKANWSHFAWCAYKTDNVAVYECKDCDPTPVP